MTAITSPDTVAVLTSDPSDGILCTEVIARVLNTDLLLGNGYTSLLLSPELLYGTVTGLNVTSCSIFDSCLLMAGNSVLNELAHESPLVLESGEQPVDAPLLALYQSDTSNCQLDGLLAEDSVIVVATAENEVVGQVIVNSSIELMSMPSPRWGGNIPDGVVFSTVYSTLTVTSSFLVSSGTFAKVTDVVGAQTITIASGGKLDLDGALGKNTVVFQGVNFADVNCFRSGQEAKFILKSTGEIIASIPVTPSEQTMRFADGDKILVFSTVPKFNGVALESGPMLSFGLGKNPLDVSSNLVFSVNETVTPVAGKFITITDLGGIGGTGYRGENVAHNFKIEATDPRIKILGSGLTTKVVVDPNANFDLDLSSNYQVSIDTGAFLGSQTGKTSQAFPVVNFTTVTPYTGILLSDAQQAYRMSDTTGSVAAGNKWIDIEGRGTGSAMQTSLDTDAAVSPLDANAGNYTFVFKDTWSAGGDAVGGVAGIETATDFAVLLKNFASGDRIYIDDAFNDQGKLNSIEQEVFTQGNGSSGKGALMWGLSTPLGDPHLYVELAGGKIATSSALIDVNSALGLVGVSAQDSMFIVG